jgi:hypothetical protein
MRVTVTEAMDRAISSAPAEHLPASGDASPFAACLAADAGKW